MPPELSSKMYFSAKRPKSLTASLGGMLVEVDDDDDDDDDGSSVVVVVSSAADKDC